MIGPGTASAFIGESAVLNPAKTDLTGPAKTILTKPTFLPGSLSGAASAGSVAEASGAAAVFEGAGILPALGGSLLAFGVGAAIGTEICGVLGIEGCWTFSSVNADPKLSGGSWVFIEKMGSYNYFPPGGDLYTSPAFQWMWAPFTGAPEARAYNAAGKDCFKPPFPFGASFFTTSTKVKGECEGSPSYEFAVRNAMENRTLTYTGADKPGVPNYSHTTPSKWSENLAAQLANPTKNGYPATHAEKLGQHIASQIEGSKVADPYKTHVEVPSCSGESWIGCKAIVEELELVPERSELTWEDAHLDLDADAVVETAPATGVEVKIGSKVVVTTNPDEAGMPIVIPQPESGETYSHYAARLNPALEPERHDLEAAFVSPSAGPNGVVEVSPEPESRLDPSTSHKVNVTTNPADAPAPIGAWSPPAIPSIDMSPLTGLSSPCTVFPFGLLCWVGEAFSQFNTAGSCPGFSAPVEGADTDFDVTMCGDTAETIMGYLRPALLLAFIVGCGFLFARATKAVGGD